MIELPEQHKTLGKALQHMAAQVQELAKRGAEGKAINYAKIEREVGAAAAEIERAAHRGLLAGLDVDVEKVVIGGALHTRVGRVAIVRGISKMLAGREAGSADDEASAAFAYAEAASVARIVERPSDDDSPAASPGVLSAVVTTERGRFSVHAHTEVAADDRGALERLIRYGLWPPLAQKRLSLTEAGNVCYRLRKPSFDGSS